MADYNLGPYRPNPRGEYSNTLEYNFLDIVNYNGNSYINCYYDELNPTSCIGIPPEGMPTSEVFWQWLGGRGEKGDIADAYKPYEKVTNGIWDFEVADKIFIDEFSPNTIDIKNVYNGCCGIIVTKQELELPQGSLKAIDFNYVNRVQDDDYYFYTFTYIKLGEGDFNAFIWHRTVVNHGYTK